MGPLGARNKKGLVAEINVTPLVDVMLVLLIIFMVAAPMMTQGLEVDLPKTTAKALRQKEDPVVVTIDKDGKRFIGKIEVTSNAMFIQQLAKLPAEAKEESIYLRADKDVPYGTVASTMADIRSAGFKKLGMVTLPTEKK